MRSFVIGLLALGLCSGCKKDAAAPETRAAVVEAPGRGVPGAGAGGNASGSVPPKPPKPSAAERQQELLRLIGELPAESRGGESPEATARAFALAVAKGDRPMLKSLLLSTQDMETLVAPDTLPKVKEGVARVLYKVGRALNRNIEIIRFAAGETKTFKQGENGFKVETTLLMKSALEVKIDGKEGKLKFRTLMKVGNRWKVVSI